jgi:hypothetical protein
MTVALAAMVALTTMANALTKWLNEVICFSSFNGWGMVLQDIHAQARKSCKHLSRSAGVRALDVC